MITVASFCRSAVEKNMGSFLQNSFLAGYCTEQAFCRIKNQRRAFFYALLFCI